MIPDGFYPVKDYELIDGYYVSKDGQVGSTNRGWFKILSLRTDKDGYLDVGLVKKDGRRSPKRVHRLMAITFLSNPNGFPVVNHKNGIKNDNRIDNIEWCSISYNTKHGYDVCGVICSRQRIVEVTNTVNDEVTIFDSVNAVCEKYNCNSSSISHRVRGKIANPSQTGVLKGLKFRYLGGMNENKTN